MFPRWLVLVVLLGGGVAPSVLGQTDGLLQMDDPMHRFLERQKTAGHLPGAFVSNQPLSVYEARTYLDTLAAQAASLGLSDTERRWVARLRGEVPQPGAAWAQRVWGRLYPNGRDLAAVDGEGYALQLNPLVYASIGTARRTEGDGTTWRNTRGIRASGHIGPIFFESRLTENQEQPANYAFTEAGGTAPRLGNVLEAGGNTYDYFTATGMVGVRSRFFEVRFGRDRNRWGFGRGTLQLSNYASAYDQLQIRTSVWRLQYTNLFTRFIDGTSPRVNQTGPNSRGGNVARPRQYGAFHRLVLEVTPRLQFEAFEAIKFATQVDSTVSRDGFDLSYLNPIIFYRAVERDLGSPDNAMIGIGGQWIAVPGVRVYGQFLLDELRVSEIGNSWWGNKWGWMLGAHLTRTGIDALSARVEFARQRPFLHAHFYPPNAYIHYNDLLGYPVGPNSRDWMISLNYRPAGRWQAEATVAYTERGLNPEGQNLGADPRITTRTRSRDRVDLLDGVSQNRIFVEAHLGWEVLPQLIVEGAFRTNIVDTDGIGTRRTVNPSIALRWGLPFASRRY